MFLDYYYESVVLSYTGSTRRASRQVPSLWLSRHLFQQLSQSPLSQVSERSSLTPKLSNASNAA